MSNAPTFNSGDWNPFSAIASLPNRFSMRGSNYRLGKEHMQHAMDFQAQHHKNVMQHLKASYKLEGKHQTHLAGLQEQSLAAAHSRNLELHSAIQKSSEGGTEVGMAFPGGGSVSYTRKQRKSAKTAPVAAPAAPAAKPQKFAQRDPDTGKISGYAETPQAPTKGKAPARKTSAKKKK